MSTQQRMRQRSTERKDEECLEGYPERVRRSPFQSQLTIGTRESFCDPVWWGQRIVFYRMQLESGGSPRDYRLVYTKDGEVSGRWGVEVKQRVSKLGPALLYTLVLLPRVSRQTIAKVGIRDPQMHSTNRFRS